MELEVLSLHFDCPLVEFWGAFRLVGNRNWVAVIDFELSVSGQSIGAAGLVDKLSVLDFLLAVLVHLLSV